MSKRDKIGLAWAKTMAVAGQLGVLQGLINSFMLVGVFYTTTVKPMFNVPLWAYLAVVFAGIATGTAFVLLIGIRGYYQFFNQQSAISEIQEQLKTIQEALCIEDE